MKVFIVLCLAVAAMAASTPSNTQVIRIGSVGVAVTDIKGSLTPKTGASAAGGVPVYEFKSSEPGSPAHDTDFVNFRCSVLADFYEPGPSASPVLICRNDGFSKGSAPEAAKTAFLFTYKGLNLAPTVKEIELVVGKSAVNSFISSHVNAPASAKLLNMEGVYDGFKLVHGSTNYESVLEYGA